MINITSIYLIEGIDNDPNKVYIGKTKNPNRRLIEHIQKYGSNIKYTVIDQVESLEYKEWEPLETYWIEQFKQWGFNVINTRKKGGSGSEYCTEDTKQKISNKLKGRVYSNITIERMSKPRKEGSGNNISLAKQAKNIKFTPEHCDNISKNSKGVSRGKGRIITWKTGPKPKIK
jgi:predicted GIY-YIG superfamily endonuclease